MKKLYFIFSLFTLINFGSIAQISVFQNAQGESSYQIFNSNSLIINTKDNSLGFSIQPKKLDNQTTCYWTFYAKTKTKESVSNILKSGDFQLNGALGGTLILKRSDITSGNIFRDFIGAELSLNRLNIFDSTKTFDDQIFSQARLGIRINLGRNFQSYQFENCFLKYLGDFSSGISVSLGTMDNSNDIDEITVLTTIKTLAQTSKGNTKSITSSKNAYDVNSLMWGNQFVRLNFDFGKHIGKILLANLHFTWAIDQYSKPILNPSFGLFMTKKGAPLDAVVGIQLNFKDYLGTRDQVKDRWDRSSLSITAGIPIP